MNSTHEATQSSAESIEAQLTARMRRAGRGSVWCAERCGDGFARNAVDQALVRMTQRQVLVRIAHGVYLYPNPHPWLGYAPAARADVLEMFVTIGVGPLIATGATAAAQYGLVTHPSDTYEYAAVGISRTIETPWWTMQIRPIAPRFVVGIHPQTATVIQAMRYIGQESWQQFHTESLCSHLSTTAWQMVCAEAAHAPVWMRRHLRDITDQGLGARADVL